MKNKNYNLGSSETTREASLKNSFDIYIPYCPKHRKINQVFLEWFLGFLETDGNFQSWKHNGQLRFAVGITQQDEIILRTIRTELGFGRIKFVTANDGIIYPELRFETKKGVLAILHLCIGNLRLVKTQARFGIWAEAVCQHFNIPMPHNPSGLATKRLTLDTAWLSGFFQAEGYFYAQYRTAPTLKIGYCIQLCIHIDQQYELSTLTEISKLLGGTVYYCNKERSSTSSRELTSISNRGGSYRFQLSQNFDLLIKYLTKYPLRGQKKIAQSRWIRVVNYLKTHELPNLGTKSYARFVRLVKNINKYQKITK